MAGSSSHMIFISINCDVMVSRGSPTCHYPDHVLSPPFFFGKKPV